MATRLAVVASIALTSRWGIGLGDAVKTGVVAAIRGHIVMEEMRSGKRSASRRLNEGTRALNARVRRLRNAAGEVSRIIDEDRHADFPDQLGAILGHSAWGEIEHILNETVATITYALEINKTARRPTLKAGGEKHPTWNSLVRNLGGDYVAAGGDTDDPSFVRGFLAMNGALPERARAVSDAALAKRVRRIFPTRSKPRHGSSKKADAIR